MPPGSSLGGFALSANFAGKGSQAVEVFLGDD
jgi:hypothetical protein